ncbi:MULTISPECIES: DUF2306 domain-containing protein [Dyella]|uniref:DUF2306 domain-containing protein n=2 Tax=Dyella TaxID=231454 RepID=A0A4R0YY45_9GAMM|nr:MULTISPECIES: DUF2306 domain-containing protein [Dyella]TBR40480.1 DUF2306 domain-containing protein [Dyella terrae]TCI11938.1 DUF2306 domain-containing protein [Dyella soli]
MQTHPTIPVDASRTRALSIAATTWVVVALIGQLIFASYVAGFYGRAAMHGRWSAWNDVLAHGYVAGDTALNVVLGLHLLFAVLVIVGGVMQLMPRIRRVAPAWHRWNGRLYLILSSTLAIGGVAMVWIRGTVGDIWQHLGITLNAALIVGFAWLAWRAARERRFDAHRRWALRLFLVVSGVWFFRVGLMFWIVVNQGPAGFDPTSFTGPFLTGLSFAQSLLPLAILEGYLRARASGRRVHVVGAFACLVLGTLVTGAGIAAASAIMWLPHL